MTEAMKEKMSARSVLAVLVGLLVTILALQGIASVKPGGFEAFAATTPSPTPTGPSVQFLNPSKKTSTELSDKDDKSTGSSKNAYHIVAWTHLAPAGSGVTFYYDPEGATNPEFEIGRATQVSGDTWEFFWDIPASVTDAGALTGNPPRTNPVTGVLRAKLFSSDRVIATDEENVTVNNKDRRPANPATQDPGEPFTVEDQAKTVEITYPANSGAMGFTGSPDGTYTGVIDVTLSDGVGTVKAYYTVDPPGTDPNFVPCNTSETAAQATDGIRCTLASGDRPDQVRAVAVVPTDKTQEPAEASQAEDTDASDAHRSVGYEQDAQTVTISPATDSQAGPAAAGAGTACSATFTATVTDTQGRKMAGANIDVHAQGPSDNLYFDDPGTTATDNSSASQPPDQGEHAKESGVDCESPSPPAFVADLQGDHERQTTPDIKHIESLVASSSAKSAGTEDSGNFRFRLLSRDPGVTQITAFVDEDFNDTHCAQEASGSASIGWAVQPSTSGVSPEQSTCTRSTPGVTPGATSTATATATATSTSTVRPTNTATSTGPTTNRTVTMSVDKSSVVAGRQVTFDGQILSGDRSCTDNEFVQIRRRVLGTTTFEEILTTGTDSQGRFTFVRRVAESADYVAVATAHDQCREGSSGEVTVVVKVKLQILASDNTPDRGELIRITSSVRPQHDGTRLILQRKKGDRWVRVDATKMNKRSIGNFLVRADFTSRTFRTLWKSQDAEHESNNSRRLSITT